MYVEIKYLLLLSSRLERFKKVQDYVYRFRCPLCGDSQRNKSKARGFVFKVKTDLLYKCHNCGISLPFPALLEKLDSQLSSEYRLEKFRESNSSKHDMRKVKKIVSTTPKFSVDILSSLTPIQKLNNSHPAREYLLNRRLPLDDLFWTDTFKEFTNSVKSGTFDDTSKDEGRIIIPFRDKEGVTFGYQGRSLEKTGLRYITILLQEDASKIFGLNRLDYDNTIYITEGPFDSLLLDNAIAMAGADVSRSSVVGGDVVFVYDNEPRNPQITQRIQKHIDSGDSVIIWPKNIREKDVNDMVLAGIDVKNVVKSNTYSGLTAKLKFNDWKK
jgi:transcription elongation factor Elf1